MHPVGFASSSFNVFLMPGDGEIGVYVHRPPRGGTCEHSRCFMLWKDDWFKLHFNVAPSTCEAAICYTESLIGELLRGGANLAYLEPASGSNTGPPRETLPSRIRRFFTLGA